MRTEGHRERQTEKIAAFRNLANSCIPKCLYRNWGRNCNYIFRVQKCKGIKNMFLQKETKFTKILRGVAFNKMTYIALMFRYERWNVIVNFAVVIVEALQGASEEFLPQSMSGRNECMGANIALKCKIFSSQKLIYLFPKAAERRAEIHNAHFLNILI